jgi:hypothetical protein
MAIEIRETIVTPTVGGDVVQLHISDAPLGDESASFVLTLQTTVEPFENPMLAHLQIEAMHYADEALTALGSHLHEDLKRQGYPLSPRPRVP